MSELGEQSTAAPWPCVGCNQVTPREQTRCYAGLFFCGVCYPKAVRTGYRSGAKAVYPDLFRQAFRGPQ